MLTILVPRGRAPFGQHQESQPLAKSNTGSPRFTDFPSLCACSESSLTNLIGSGLNLLCLQSHPKTECRWTRPEVAILGADQKERGLWGREWVLTRRRVAFGDESFSFSSLIHCVVVVVYTVSIKFFYGGHYFLKETSFRFCRGNVM